MKQSPALGVLLLLLALSLAACGGGGEGGSQAPDTPSTGAAATSSGAITAFGSVFVNGHEFATGSVQVVDDDTGDTTGRVASLEVGQVVDVQPASDSTGANPRAQWLHVHPLVRGHVDAATASTIMVMGQSVSLDSGTLLSDHRACVNASANPCTAIVDVSGLASTGGGTPGSYVSVDGYLFSGASAAAQIVATLVSVHDVPGAHIPAAFKVEGQVSATASTSSSTYLTIGGLSIALDHATCRVDGHARSCAGAFTSGDVVSVFSATAPALPATAFDASVAIARKHLPVQAAGAAVEFDGRVSTSSATSFVVRGVNVDASALPAGTALPAAGDLVRVAGTVAGDGLSVTATAITVLHAARCANYGLAGDVTAVAPGAASGTFEVTVLGQTIVVGAQTRLSDHQARRWFEHDPQANPFNITTFQAYLDTSASKHVAVKAAKDGSGTLQALSFSIGPTSTLSEVAGPVDATPAPVMGSSSAPTTFSIDGVAVSAASGAVHFLRHASGPIGVGDAVLASGSFAAGVLGVTATEGFGNFVIDFGAPHGGEDDLPLY